MNQPLTAQLRPGWHMAWQDQVYQIVSFDANRLQVQAQESATGDIRVFALDELLLNGDAPPQFAPTVQALTDPLARAVPRSELVGMGLPEALLQRAEALVAIVEAVEQHVAEEEQRALRQGEPFRRTTALQRAVTRLDPPLALSTFYKYRRLYQTYQGSRTQLAAGLRRSTLNQSQMSAAQLHFIDTLILRYYARSRPLRPLTLYQLAQSILQRTQGQWVDPERCSPAVPLDLVDELLDHRLPVATLMNNPEKAARLTAITLPSRSWFYTYLRWFEAQPGQGEAVVTARHGREVWEREHLVFDTFVTRASFPLQYVFADHWLVDVFTVDETTRRQLDRLWLTVLIDAYSRSILGMALLYEMPCIQSIQQALLHAIWPKTSHRALGLEDEWVCYGIPQQLSLDNAWAHHSHSLEDLARSISQNGRYNSIDLVFRPPYRGRYGALIERFFGNLSAQVKAYLPGAILSSDPRQRRQAAAQACLLYRDIDRFLHQVILTYQHTPHSELHHLTPHEKWVEGLQAGLPLVPALTPAVERLFWRLDPETRVVTSKGVAAFGLHYWSPDWSGIERVGRDGQPVRYRFRYNPADLSQIALFRDGRWMGDGQAKELRQPDGTLRPLSLVERSMAQTWTRQQGEPVRDWLRFLHEIDDLAQTRQAEKRKALRQPPVAGARRRSPGDVQATQAALEPLLASASEADYTDWLARFMESTRGEHENH